MWKKYFLLLISLFFFLPTGAFAPRPEREIKEAYFSILEMRIQIYRISRDKIYEIIIRIFL
jgi:hypothetical protein